MKKNSQKAVNVFSEFGMNVVLVITGTFMFYSISQMIELSILKRTIFINFNENLINHLFSLEMFPTLFAYGALIAIIYYLYKKTKRMMILIHENDIKSEREQAVLQTSQRITGMMAEYISRYNADIKQWIEERNKKGQQAPDKIVNANMKIALALHTLTEVSFVLPYVKENHVEIDDYTNYLENNLREITYNEAKAIELY